MGRYTLNAQQERFVNEYMKSGNAYEAAKLAGYTESSAKQGQPMKCNAIKMALKERRAKIEQEGIADAEEIYRFFTDCMRGNATGTEMSIVFDGTGKQVVEMTEKRPSLKERQEAGKQLAKLLGLDIQRVQQEEEIRINWAGAQEDISI